MVYSETIVALKAKGKLGADHPRDRRHRQQASASSEPNYICRRFFSSAESAFSASAAFSRTVCRSAQADPKYLKQAQDIPLMHFLVFLGCFVQMLGETPSFKKAHIEYT